MRIAICDDNTNELSFYSEQIRLVAERAGVPVDILKLENAKQAVFSLSDASDSVDVLFLDINMPDMNGISLARKLNEIGYRKDIVFLTVSTEHMLPAFDVGAYNYIVKNKTSNERFEAVVLSALESAKKKSSAFMLFSAGGENINVAVPEIIYFELINRIITVHYGTHTFEFFSTLGKLENKLRNYGFIRIHRSILVSKSYIKSFTYDELTLKNGEKLPVSRGNYAILKDAMTE